MLKLVPSVKLSIHRNEDINVSDSNMEYQKKRRAVLEQNDYTCQGCGFRVFPDMTQESHTLIASGYLEIHHVDNDHTNNDPANLAALCPFCHSVLHIGFAGKNNLIRVAYIPYLTQSQVCLFSNLIGVALVRRDPKNPFNNRKVFEKAIELKNIFEQGESIAEQVFGEGINNASVLSSALVLLEKKKLYVKRGEFFESQSGIRIIPYLESYEKQILYWSQFHWLPSAQYENEWNMLWESQE